MLIGLYSPYPQAGKSTFSDYLCEKHNFHRVKMAGALKHMLASYFEYVGIEEDFIPNYLEGALKEYPSPLLAGKTPRHAMQTLGTEWGRNCMGQILWERAAETAIQNHLKSNQNVVVDDIRFSNEFEMIKRNGGLMVKVTRPDLRPSSSTSHVSEGGLENSTFDFYIENTYTSVDDFKNHLDSLPFLKGVSHVR